MPRQTSIQLTESTRRQAAALTAAGFGTFTDIVRTAIDRMYTQEKPMLAYQIGKIDTTPDVDPYHANTGGQTKTALFIDPARRIVGLYQAEDSGAYSSDVWHSLVLEETLTGYPEASAARELLTDNPDVIAIISGHAAEWDGSNMVGRLTDEACEAWTRLVKDLNELSEYTPNPVQLWQVDDWFSGVSDADLGLHAGMTDAEITALAEKLENDARDNNAIIAGGTEKYLRSRLEDLDED